MEYRPLDITLISAEGIKNMNLFTKMDVYAVASIMGYPSTKKTTYVDKGCGKNPRWNFPMTFVLDEALLGRGGLCLHIELRSKRILGDKDIGEVVIPLHDLQDNSISNDANGKVLEYQVRTSISKKARGTLKFSYKFGEKTTQDVQATQKNKQQGDEPVTAYPAPPMHGGAPPYGGMAYPQPPPAGMPYPPQGYAGYPPQQQHGVAHAGYPPQAAPGYGYHQPPPPGYGYGQPGQQFQKPKKNRLGMGTGMGLGLGAGLLGGLLVGDMVSDVGEMAAYGDGYNDAMGDMGGFDF